MIIMTSKVVLCCSRELSLRIAYRQRKKCKFNCRVVNNGRHGLFLAGNNANAGRTLRLSCMDNSAWAIYDRSLLGNTYVGSPYRK